jgi:chromosome segregation ATPase
MSSIQTYQVLADLLLAIKELQENPKVLEEIASQAYTLGKQGEEKLKAAHETIAQADVLEAALAAKRAEIAQIGKDIEARREELAQDVAQHEANIQDFNSKVIFFKQEQEDHAIKAAETEAKRKKLSDASVELAKQESALGAKAEKHAEEHAKIDARWEEVKTYEAKLKAHAAKLREQAASLAE